MQRTTDNGQRTLLRLLWIIGFAFWMGGFVFYTSYVVPILLREVGESGIVTRHVAVIFNRLGGVVLSYWFLTLWIERRQTDWRRTALFLLVVNTVIQGVLFWAYDWVIQALQAVPDSVQPLSDPVFYFRHRVYLWLHSLQLLLSIGSLALALRRWQLADRSSPLSLPTTIN